MPPLQFETPENVLIQYEAAGLGTRFIAWFVDQFVIWVVAIVLTIALLVAGVSFDAVGETLDEESRGRQHVMFVMGIIILVWGLGSFVYFGASELLLGGQTIGKRSLKIRVVRANGFQLDAPSVVLRNLFRVVDHLPPLWLVPLLTARSQRAGDLAAGTLVVNDARTELSSVRTTLSARADAPTFHFDRAGLNRLATNDFSTLEMLLDRWSDLSADEQAKLAGVFSARLAKKLNVEPPAAEMQLQFLQDLLVAEFRRRDRGMW